MWLIGSISAYFQKKRLVQPRVTSAYCKDAWCTHPGGGVGGFFSLVFTEHNDIVFSINEWRKVIGSGGSFCEFVCRTLIRSLQKVDRLIQCKNWSERSIPQARLVLFSTSSSRCVLGIAFHRVEFRIVVWISKKKKKKQVFTPL